MITYLYLISYIIYTSARVAKPGQRRQVQGLISQEFLGSNPIPRILFLGNSIFLHVLVLYGSTITRCNVLFELRRVIRSSNASAQRKKIQAAGVGNLLFLCNEVISGTRCNDNDKCAENYRPLYASNWGGKYSSLCR